MRLWFGFVVAVGSVFVLLCFPQIELALYAKVPTLGLASTLH
jgi:hypothetical protein